MIPMRALVEVTRHDVLVPTTRTTGRGTKRTWAELPLWIGTSDGPVSEHISLPDPMPAPDLMDSLTVHGRCRIRLSLSYALSKAIARVVERLPRLQTAKSTEAFTPPKPNPFDMA